MPNVQPIKSVNVAGTVHPLDSVFTVLSGISTVAGSASSSSYKSVRWYVSDVSGITEPYDGMKLAIKVPLAGVATAGAVLSINGDVNANYHPLAYNINTALTTHFPVNSIKIFTYDANQTMDCYLASKTKVTVTGVWKAESNYDSNTTITYGTLAYYFRPYAAQTIYRYKFVMLDKDNRLVPLTTTNVADGTAVTNQTPTDKAFRPEKIYWYSATGTISAGAAVAGNTLVSIGYNANNSTNGGMAVCNFNSTIAAYRMIYLCGTYNKSTGLFTLRDGGTASSTNYYVQVPTNTANLDLSTYFNSSYDYILLGGTYSSNTYIHLMDNNPMYYFDGTNLIPYSATDTGATSIEATGTGNVVSGASYDTSTRKITLTKGVTALTSHQSIKTLKTDNTDAQTASSSEALNGSGTINLHKIAKTGNYNDLLNRPTIPTDTNQKIKAKNSGTDVTFGDNAVVEIKAGTNVQVAANATDNTITISSTDTNTTYTVASGDSNGQIKVTPSGGNAYNVDVKGLGAAAYKAVDASVTSGSANLVTSGAVYTAINNLPEPMVFKGTLGTGGTITSLPTASSSEGYTYKVITAGTYASQSAKVGDVFVSNGSAWVLIPAGDDVEDTWRNIKVNDNELLGTGISTGAVNFKNGGNITVTGSGNNITLGVTSGYSIPSTTNQTAWSAKYNKPSGGIPDSDLASTFIKKVNNSTPDSNGNVSVTNLVPTCAVGSDSANTAGWYKIASSTLSGYGNQNILYFVKGGFTNGYSGILNLEMRSENTSVQCWKCCWVARHPNLTEGSVIIVINGMTWTMYAYNDSSQYGRLYFTEISNRSIDGGSPTWSITYFNSNTPEATKPTATATSSDGFIVARAKEASDACKIVETLRKGSEADSAVGYYKIATINHVTWNFCDFCMLVKNSYAGTTYSTVINCSCSDSNVKLQNFNLEIISGTDISDKLAYLYTYDSGNNLIKIEVFIHATRFEHPMCYIINARTGQQLVVPTQDEFNKATPDKPDGTTMTGYATYAFGDQVTYSYSNGVLTITSK